MKAIKIIHILLTIILTAAFVLFGVFVFRNSYLRLVETAKDFYKSVVYYGSTLFSIKTEIVPTVNGYSEVFSWQGYLPDSLDKVKEFFSTFFATFVSEENFNLWLNGVMSVLGVVLEIIVFALPIVLVLVILIKKAYRRYNNNYNRDTVPLKIFKFTAKISFVPVYNFIRGYVNFLRDKRWIKIIWILLWAFNLNLSSIAIGFFAYYFYFTVAFDMPSLFIQLSKLLIDLQVAVKTIPIIFWVFLGFYLWDKGRKKIAVNTLRHHEAKNCGFIKELAISSLSCGSMGKKKTTLITDMALSQAVMFRQEAFTRLQKADMKFPNFPWICFENEILKCMEHGVIYNLASIKKWIELKRKRFDRHGNEKWQLYGYDIKRYGDKYNGGLKEEKLFDVLKTYAELYFIYVIETSLIVSNYSIREDSVMMNAGNFPMWAFDFFGFKRRVDGRYSHILDFDILRLGKKLIKDNGKAGSFEFGVIVITEIGKERGNNLELKEIKKEEKETNQKNDLFNSWLKMCRHSATVDNFPFIKVFCDEQRPESWGADARDLADIITIEKSGEQKLSLPFYTIEEMLTEWAYNKFNAFYYELRYLRGDNTLLIYLLKKVTAYLFKRNEMIYNRYGFSVLSIEKERGTMDGKKDKKKYYLSNYKIYSDRFSTDCFSDYFNDLAVKTKKGLRDYMAYKTSKASVKELLLQNSYFINSLYKGDGGDNSA
ncbi:MAG: hypothetical protein IJQ66_00410 [Clostridia bacterium]|nr:hypothetical protein [Clostridia bacterium]